MKNTVPHPKPACLKSKGQLRRWSYAERMREHPTKAEAALWPYLERHCWRWQYVISYYIGDFGHWSGRMILEVDGGYHDSDEQREHDAKRTQRIERGGYLVVRVTNDEALADPESVAERFSKLAHKRDRERKDALRVKNGLPPLIRKPLPE